MTPQAHLIISGKALEHDFPLCDLETLVASIEEELLSRGTTLTRRAVTLGAERQIAAPLFLSAGFETLPADDEDVQASTTILSTAFGLAPPDEIVFLLGFESEPINFLRSLAGRVKRTPIFLGSSARNAPSPAMRRASEHLLYLSDSATKIGADWAQFELGNWKYWERQFELALGALDSQETLAIERQGSEESLYDADEAQERESVDDYDSVDDLTLGIEIPEGEEEFISAPVLDGALVFAENANEWNEELESYLREQDLTCSAWLAVDKLDLHFKGISNFYISDREGFKKLLSSNIRLIEEEQGNSKFYHIEHPEMRPASPANLTFGVKEKEPERESFESCVSKESEDANLERETFRHVAKRATLHAEESRWMVERASLSSQEVVARENDIASRAKELNLFFWQRSNLRLLPEAFSEMADCYDLLYDALMLMDNVESSREVLPEQVVFEAMQALANAQCLVKTGLILYDVPILNEPVQRDAYFRLMEFRKNYYPSHVIDNLKLDSYVELSDLGKVRKEYERVAEKVDSFLGARKQRVDVEKKLKYHLERIKNDPDSERLHDWNVVIQSVTDLVVEFNVPYSSLFFRESLKDLIDRVPEKANVTVEFGYVAQEIDEYKELELEREEARRHSSPTERAFSKNVLAVREHLAGGQIVFIGGTPKEHIRERIEKAFGVKMIWVVADHGDSLDRFEPYLRDPDVKLFLSYIPWCSHKHSEEFVADYTKRWGKESVRLRKGTNPEQIAVSIIKQLKLEPKRVEE